MGVGALQLHAGPRPEAGLVLLAARSSSRRCWPASASICSSCTCSPRSGRSCRPACSRTAISSAGVSMVFFTATVMLASSALMAPYLESLAGYPVETAGLSMAPRGIGTMIGMQIGQPAVQPVRPPQADGGGAAGPGLRAVLHELSGRPTCRSRTMMVTLLLQGFGIGFVFNPMTVMAFTTLPAALRGYATSLQALCRNLGQAVGVSVTSLHAGAQHADVARRHRRPGSRRSTGCCRRATRRRTCWIRRRGTARRCWTR